MRIGELFETKVEEKIEPVIKVGETGDEHKLAAEIGSYVITPLIEKYLDDFLEHYTETFLTDTTEIGAWISGYFGSGKSHLAKVMGLLTENRKLAGLTACKRFIARIPPGSPREGSLQRSLARMNQCDTHLLAFNLNTLADSKSRPLPSLLLSQYYLAKGYGTNLIYARVIEAELDRQGKLDALHQAVEQKANRNWSEIQRNLSFFRRHLYAAACEVAPEVFDTVQDVERALREAERGELYNVEFLVDTVLQDLVRREREARKPQRVILVLDESGQWIENDSGRLAQLQALIEEAAVRGQGKIWIIVTTHGDIGSIYKEARALEGDMKKIEGRFRFKFGLTTENIELVLEDRLLRKTVAGKQQLAQLYHRRGSGSLRGLGELADTNQALPSCTEEKFITYYPFFPYQIHLIPEIVKTLRSKGGRGEQLSGSTRTLLAITQDILRAGRHPYLEEGLGRLVRFDEIYANLAGEGEVSPDVRTELSRLRDVVPEATTLTPCVAEVLYLLRELPYIPRTRENLARLLAEDIEDDIPTVLARIDPELERLRQAKLVARTGEEYEFLTGERRTFEDAVIAIEAEHKQGDRERGLIEEFVHASGKAHWRRWLDFDTVPHLGQEFPFSLAVDGHSVPGKQGDTTLQLVTPLGALGAFTLDDLESRSLRSDEQTTIFFLSGRVKSFDQDLTRFLAMREVIRNWQGDARRSEEARRLAQERESNDLPKLERRVLDGLREGIRTGWVIFRGASRSLSVKQGQKPSDALRAELATFWPVLYPKFERVPVRITNDQRAIQEVLAGTSSPSRDVSALKLYDNGGKVDPNSPLLDALRMHLATEQNADRRVLGKELLDVFSGPPYGWDPNAVRVGVAALVRMGAVKVLVNKKAYTNPTDRELVDALRVSRNFYRTELVLEITEVDPDALMETRSFLIQLARRRGIDETPAALSEVAVELAGATLAKLNTLQLWASASAFPLPPVIEDGGDVWQHIQDLTNPIHRVLEIHANRERLEEGRKAIDDLATFQQEKGGQFTELTQFVAELRSVQYRLPSGSALHTFLDSYRAASASASLAEKETWQHIQSLKAQASLELQSQIGVWQAEARERIDKALEQLPEELQQRGLDLVLREKLSEPLYQLRTRIDDDPSSSDAASLGRQVDQAIQQLSSSVVAEVQKANQTQTSQDESDPKQVRQLSFHDLVMVTRVTSKQEWETLRSKLDARVYELLEQGFQVELK